MGEIRRIEEVAEIDSLLEESRVRPVFVFKHSLICPISSWALDAYRRFAEDPSALAGARCALVEIQRARAVSEAIAQRTGVRHESPQAILLRDQRAVWHASHRGITEEALAASLRG